VLGYRSAARREFPPSVAASTQFMCPIPRPSLESGLSQHPLGFFQGELRVVDQYDCEQFGPYLSETKQLRLPAFTIGGIGVHARRVGPGGGARQAINSGLVNASAGGSTMFASCCLADRVDRWHGRGDLHRSHWGASTILRLPPPHTKRPRANLSAGRIGLHDQRRRGVKHRRARAAHSD
jgi:hypothetical protein